MEQANSRNGIPGRFTMKLNKKKGNQQKEFKREHNQSQKPNLIKYINGPYL